MTKKTPAMSALDRTAYRGRSRLEGVLLVSGIVPLAGRFKASVRWQLDLYQKSFTQVESPADCVAALARE